MEARRDGSVPLKFIRDVASDSDFFGTHERVASAIAEVVQTNGDIKVIGLLGPWGSGKSTVVQLLGRHLNSEGALSNLVFTYDAWLHQSDPPRRSFLETLLHFLIDKGMTSEEEWSEKLDVLNRRIEDNVTTTTPRLKWPGTLMVLSLFLVPLGSRFATPEWLKAAFSANQNQISTTHAGLVLALSLACLLAPLALAGTFYFFWRTTRKFWTRAFWTRANLLKHRKPYQDESILAVFMNRETKTDYNRVIREPEPSAIEFQDAFREIVEKVIPKDQRLIIVIDNLDRLPESEAVALWATIRGFFLGASGGLRARKAPQHPVVLLPIAEDAIERLYDDDGEDGPSRARSFMDKTFDLTFYVNRPVLTKWSDYLRRQMSEVFGDRMTPSWPFITAGFYERYSRRKEAPAITPRGVNTLVNAIATRWLQWHGIIEFPSIAYYCTFREEIEKDILAAVAKPIVPMREYDDTWQKSVAAIYYGVHPDQVEEVLLEQPLRKVIGNPDAAAFKTMTSIVGFPLTLHKVVEDLAASEVLDLETALNVSWLLGQMPSDYDRSSFMQTWALLRANVGNDQAMDSFGSFEASALKHLFESAPNNKKSAFAELCGERLAKLTMEGARHSDFVPAFMDFWMHVLNHPSGVAPKHIVAPGNAKTFFDIALSCIDQPALLDRLTTATDHPALAQQLALTATEAKAGGEAERQIGVFFQTHHSVDWAQLTNGLTAIVRAPIVSQESMAAALLALGYIWAETKTTPTDFAALATDGSLNNRLNEAYPSAYDTIIARSVALLVLLGKPFTLPDQGNWLPALNQRPQLREEIDQSLRSFSGTKSAFTRIVKAVKSSPTFQTLAADIATRWVKLKKIGRLSLEDAIDNLSSYQELLQLDENKTAFVIALADYQGFWKLISDRSLEKEAGDILQRLLENPGTKTKAEEELRRRLLDLSRDDWKAGLLTGTRTFELARSVQANEEEIGDSASVYGALDDTLGDLLLSKDPAMISRWFVASTFVSEGARSTLFKNLRDRVNTGMTVGSLAILIDTGGKALIEDGEFAHEPDDSVRHVMRPLLDSGELSVLTKLKGELAAWLKACPPLTRSFIHERLDALQLANEGEAPTYDTLRAAWGFPELHRDDEGKPEEARA